jgi:hypothetical protein
MMAFLKKKAGGLNPPKPFKSAKKGTEFQLQQFDKHGVSSLSSLSSLSQSKTGQEQKAEVSNRVNRVNR